jgi:hypothetical protein
MASTGKLISIFVICVIGAGEISCIINNPQYCASEKDCDNEETLLFCVEGKCQCLNRAVQDINGQRFVYDMVWFPNRQKCLSIFGSTCTLTDRRYQQGPISRIDCTDGAVCRPITRGHSSAAATSFSTNRSPVNFDSIYQNELFSRIGAFDSLGVCKTLHESNQIPFTDHSRNAAVISVQSIGLIVICLYGILICMITF